MAITEDDIIAINAAGTGDASSGTLDLASTNTTGSTAALLMVAHEGASTSYTWSHQSGGSGGTFASLGTLNASVGAGSGDLSLNVSFVYGMTGAAAHVFRVTLGASRAFRYGGGIVLGGTFDASHLSATTQTAQDGASNQTVDAGSLVTDAAAYLAQFSCNYNGQTATQGSGWTLKSNATSGRHFQARNEAASGTFDPVHTIAGDGLTWLTIAVAIKEAVGGGGTYNAVPLLDDYYRHLRRGIFH